MQGQGPRPTSGSRGLAGFQGELPPRVALGEQGVGVGTGPHPRRVPHLQVEPAAGEHGCEGQLPVEEPLLVGELLARAQPRVVPDDLVHRCGGGEAEVDGLVVPDLFPGGPRAEPFLALPDPPLAARGLAVVAAEQGLQCGDPLGKVRRGDPLLLPVDLVGGEGVGEGPEPQGGPGVHDELEPTVRAIESGQLGLDLLALHGAADRQVVRAPDGDGAADLLLGDLQPPQGDLPERLDPVSEVDQGAHLLLGGLDQGGLPPGLEPVQCLGGEFLGLLRIDRGAPALGG